MKFSSSLKVRDSTFIGILDCVMQMILRDLEAGTTNRNPITVTSDRLINHGTYQQDMENRRLEIESLAERRILGGVAVFATCCCFTSYLGLFMLVARMIMY